MARRELGTYHDLAILILRIGSGALLLTHGWSKMLRIVEQGTQAGFGNPLGIGEFPSLLLTTFAEFICTILIIIGWKTRLAAIPPAIVMIVAALVVHPDDPWSKQELPLLYLSCFIALILMGSGKYSVDRK